MCLDALMANTSGKVPLNTRVTEELDQWVHEAAKRQDRSISSVVERALKDAKAKEEP